MDDERTAVLAQKEIVRAAAEPLGHEAARLKPRDAPEPETASRLHELLNALQRYCVSCPALREALEEVPALSGRKW